MRTHDSLLIVCVFTIGVWGCTDPKIVSLAPDGAADVGPSDASPRDGALDIGPSDGDTPDAAAPCGPQPATAVGVGPAGDCVVRVLPPRPRECAPDVTTVRIQVALQNGELRPLEGFDLDGFCTDTVGGAAACTPSDIPRADRPLGYDNGWIDTFTDLLLFDSAFESTLVTAQNDGLGVPLILVEGWNGEPFDEEVDVTVLSSVSGTGAAGGAVQWDGGDVFLPSTRWFADGLPLIRDRNAYVVNGLLVASLPDGVPLFLPYRVGVDYPIVLDEGRFVATLDAATATISDSRFLGRWSLDAAIESLTALGLCDGSVDPMMVGARMMGIKVLTDSADLRLDPVDDGGDPLLSCNAISLQATWGGSVPATWGDAVAPTSVTTLCP